jgi:quinoprotein relay system zinc metallohydrolase 2
MLSIKGGAPRIDAPRAMRNPQRMTPRFGLVLLAALFSAAASSVAAFEVQTLAPGVHVHPGQQVGVDDPARGDSANLGLVVGARCVAVIDTGGSVATGRAWRAAIARLTTLPVCYVINTHGHFDHVLGNAAFADSGARFVGHPALAESLEASRDFFARRFAPELGDTPAAAIVVPDTAVESTQDIDLGGRILRLQAQPVAHSAADLTVLDLTSGTLFSGDLLSVQRLPVLDGNLRAWQAWLRDTPAPVRVVPGHGSVSDWVDATAPQAAYLALLASQARAALDEGVFLEDVVEAARKAALEGWILTAPHPRNMGKAYRELEWE